MLEGSPVELKMSSASGGAIEWRSGDYLELRTADLDAVEVSKPLLRQIIQTSTRNALEIAALARMFVTRSVCLNLPGAGSLSRSP